jgi:hypothetical protein
MNHFEAVDRAVALRRAWWTWGMLVGGSVIALLVLLPQVGAWGLEARAWALLPVLWLLMAVPATIAVYGQCFRGEWSAGPAVVPADYLRGIRSIWGVLAAGLALSVVACFLTGSVTPAIWPGVLMLMLLILARPSLPEPRPAARSAGAT